jgi:hypothetical protein
MGQVNQANVTISAEEMEKKKGEGHAWIKNMLAMQSRPSRKGCKRKRQKQTHPPKQASASVLSTESSRAASSPPNRTEPTMTGVACVSEESGDSHLIIDAGGENDALPAGARAQNQKHYRQGQGVQARLARGRNAIAW